MLRGETRLDSLDTIRRGESKMKILMIGFTKIKYMPYMNFYYENLDLTANEVHVLYWNRDLKEEDVSFLSGATLHEFRCWQEDDAPKMSKVGSFVKFRRYARGVLDRENFDFVIFLHSLPGILICDQLLKKYPNRFIFDYRDSTYEAFGPFKRIVGKLVEASGATFVSSDAFRRFLPETQKNKIITSHNLLMDSLAHREEKKLHATTSEKIRIAFWGFIRHEEINREIIKKIAADTRFELHYYGREQQVALNLKQYAKELCARNVFFHGEYKPQDRYEFVRNTDLIHNIYMDANMMLAMGNKYYDAAIFYIPLVSMAGSFMAEAAEKAHIGFHADPREENFTEQLYDAYMGLDRKNFEQNCDMELERVLSEYTMGAELVRKLTSPKRGK